MSFPAGHADCAGRRQRRAEAARANAPVFCPPRMVLPEDGRPFCLFLDELPAAPPDVQKAFYSLLLERRLGEHRLPPGTWVVAAGNRTEDQALARSLSSALINRVFILTIRVDVAGWLVWAEQKGVRPEVRGFIRYVPQRCAGRCRASRCPSRRRARGRCSRRTSIWRSATAGSAPTSAGPSRSADSAPRTPDCSAPQRGWPRGPAADPRLSPRPLALAEQFVGDVVRCQPAAKSRGAE